MEKNEDTLGKAHNKVNEKCHPICPGLEFNIQGDWALTKLFI